MIFCFGFLLSDFFQFWFVLWGVRYRVLGLLIILMVVPVDENSKWGHRLARYQAQFIIMLATGLIDWLCLIWKLLGFPLVFWIFVTSYAWTTCKWVHFFLITEYKINEFAWVQHIHVFSFAFNFTLVGLRLQHNIIFVRQSNVDCGFGGLHQRFIRLQFHSWLFHWSKAVWNYCSQNDPTKLYQTWSGER